MNSPTKSPTGVVVALQLNDLWNSCATYSMHIMTPALLPHVSGMTLMISDMCMQSLVFCSHLNTLLIEYKDNVHRLLFVITMLITVKWPINPTIILLHETQSYHPRPSETYECFHQCESIFHVGSYFVCVAT